MDKGTCSVDGCERRAWARRLCNTHLSRLHRLGTTELPPKVARVCSVEGCGRKHFCRGWCTLHHGRWLAHGDPVAERDYATGERHGMWNDGSNAYQTAHDRVRSLHGKAASHHCVGCGGVALVWAYDHGDQNERVCGKSGCVYSTDPAHYVPMCARCHYWFDREHRLGASVGP